MIVAFVVALIAAYVVYTFVYSIRHGYNDAAVIIAVATALIALLLWCEVAWSMML